MPNNFVWYEHMTTDLAAAEAFYGAVMGWTAKDSGMAGMRYDLLCVGDKQFGGAMALPADALAAGARPGWMAHVGVDDVDAFAARVKEAGGAVHREPQDIPGVGRFAMVADPQGAMFFLFMGNGPAPERPAFGAPGFPGWHELHAADGQSALAFYSRLFGWTKGETHDMGPMGIYQLFTAGAAPIGGMMTKAADTPAPVWLYYFNVDDIEAAAGRVKGAGGEVLMGPHEVPGGGWIVHARDPQGALFALTGPHM
ncbi:MAG: VOC family protein [Caulobacteraceae bacterium]